MVGCIQRLQHTITFMDETTPTSKAKPVGVMGAEVWVKVDDPQRGVWKPPSAGRRAYCAGRGNHGLHIVDVGDPRSPTFLGEYDTPSAAYHVAVDEPYVYVSDHYGGVFIFRVPAQGDADQDWDVDMVDYDLFSACLTGPGGGVSPGCDVFDFYDVSSAVDMHDFLLFQTNFTGP